MEKIIHHGIAASPGIVIGKALILSQEDFCIKMRKLQDKEIEQEIIRFQEALNTTKQELIAIRDKVNGRLGTKHATIFEAYLLVLDDPMLVKETIAKIRKERMNVEYVFSQTISKFAHVFTSMGDEYLRERGRDIQDLGKRVLHNLLGEKKHSLSQLKEEVIIIANDLTPSDTVQMREEKILGFITNMGGKTSHTAIMAQSLGIPAIVGLKDITAKVKTGDEIILDGYEGIVVINPVRSLLEEYEKRNKKYIEIKKQLHKLKDLPAVTLDGREVQLVANIEIPDEVELALESGATGIGLFRTEFIYLNRADLPGEEEQTRVYRNIAKKIAPHSVVLRTLDLGGDKLSEQLGTNTETNPFLGLRGIRLCLKYQDLFRAQLRAILQASTSGKIKIMYPMISTVEEIKKANHILDQVKDELKKEHIDFDKDLEVGAMIETPSAALTADVIAREVDFLSIGSNDLIQYTIAVDRGNENVAYLYEPLHPSILRQIKYVIEAGHRAGKLVGMCGEMAGEPELALILLGMGLDEFSMGSANIPKIKKVIREATMNQAKGIVNKILDLPTVEAIKKLIKQTHIRNEE
ncbi:MAG: phosphoenolpyruvate--protein phosphotransferase [Elusimicrobia bacterium]|nr:phosphoenolpyruvate--protein phosphotransferase [Elusimicrobiota bacterium]